MTVRSTEDNDTKTKVQQVIEFTKCSEVNAEEALEQCGDDVELAVGMIFDKGLNVDDWQIKNKNKIKKLQTPVSNIGKTEKPLNKNKRDTPKPKDTPKKKNERRPKKQSNEPSTVNPTLVKSTPKEQFNIDSSPVQENNWEVESDYDEWNGEAIEILNSNSQIALETCEEPRNDNSISKKVAENIEKSLSQKVKELFSKAPVTKQPPKAVRFPLVKPVIFSPDLLTQNSSRSINVTFGDVMERKTRLDPKIVSIPKVNMDTYQNVKSDQRVVNQSDIVSGQTIQRNQIEMNHLKQSPGVTNNMINNDPVRNNFQQFRNMGYNSQNIIEPNTFVDVEKLSSVNIVDNMIIQPSVSSACSPGNLNHVIQNNQHNMRRSNHTNGSQQNSQQLYNHSGSKQNANQYNKPISSHTNLGMQLPPGINQPSQIVGNIIGASNDHHTMANPMQMNSHHAMHHYNANNRSNPVINNEQNFSSSNNTKGNSSMHNNQQPSSLYFYDQNSYQANPRNMSNPGNYEMSDMKISSTKNDTSQMVTMVHSGGHQSSQSHPNIQSHLVDTPLYQIPNMMFMSPVSNTIYAQGPPHHSNNATNGTGAPGNPNNQTNEINFHQNNFANHKQNPNQSLFNQNSQFQHPQHHNHQSQQMVAAQAVAQLQDMQKNFSGSNDYKSNSYDKSQQQNSQQVSYMQGGNGTGGQSQNYFIVSGPKQIQNKAHR